MRTTPAGFGRGLVGAAEIQIKAECVPLIRSRARCVTSHSKLANAPQLSSCSVSLNGS